MLGLRRLRHLVRPRVARGDGGDFMELYALTPIGAALLSPRGRFLKCNRAVTEFLGYSEDELLDMDFDSVTYHEDIGNCRGMLERLRRGYIRHFAVDKRYVRKDGQVVWAHAVVTMDPRGRGRPMKALLIDITGRMRSEEALRSAERQLEKLRQELEVRVRERTAELELRNALLAAMQETSIDGILATDLKRRIIAFNQRLLEIWGAPRSVAEAGDAEETARYALRLVEEPQAFLRRTAHLYAHRLEKGFDEVRLRDGRTLERYSSPILDARGRAMGRVWYYRDITERRLAQRQLEQRTAELARSNADLETYAYAASHDLGAPVRKISAYSELLARSARHKLDGAEREMLAVIRRAAGRMSTLIDDVLTFRRLSGERLPALPVDLTRAVKQALADLELPVSETEAEVEIGELGSALGHENNLRRLFQNLLSNALKFHRPGERPHVRVEAVPAPEGFVEVSVSDNGIGFEPRFADRIFRPFTQLNPAAAYGGSGMGLAICRRIVQAHGGSIRAWSEPRGGAVFTVRLRAAPAPSRR